ncbi:hypothetical protein N0B16_01285 [Chryseobacterium sp. GMJ5]|uniref:Antitoxin component YwqK of the YwqJK toxin-antitoxin module n=1 Tax=Chryseobacterium gilvum TaxID=2976534 RepID=A0ABT2VSW4_9FLAO|nr:hypothetical protein [Chryseobacterium gilvum]MCU7613062.1 hypothetical protein [Chryseobacterium gilvum]
MNKLIIIITTFFLIGCNGQDKNDLKNKNMKTANFDIAQFDKDRETVYDGEKIVSGSVTDTVKEGTRIRALFDEGYTENVEPENSFFGVYKEYYKSGVVKKLRTKNLVSYIEGFAPWGMEYEYDKNGKLINETDNEKLYQNVKVNPDRLFQILDEKNIFKINNPAKHRLSIWFHDKSVKSKEMVWNKLKYADGENPFWEVVKDLRTHDEEPVNEKVYKIDAVTGTVSEIK